MPHVGEGAAAIQFNRGDHAVLSNGDMILVAAESTPATRLLLIAAKKLGEAIVCYGPFVMNTEAEIHQAIENYRAGHF